MKRVVVSLLVLLVLASASSDDVVSQRSPSTMSTVGDTVEAKYEDEDFMDPSKPPMFESKKWETEAAPGAQPGDTPPVFLEVSSDERSELHNTLQIRDLPAGRFQEAGYDTDDFVAWSPNSVNPSFLEAAPMPTPETITTFFEVNTGHEKYQHWPEAIYDEESEPRFQATPASVFAAARRNRSARRNALSPGTWEGSKTTADVDYNQAFRLIETSSEEVPAVDEAAAATASVDAPVGDTPPSAGMDPNVVGLPTYTGNYPYPVPQNAFVSRGVPGPYYSVPVNPMIPQYQAPFMQSPPINLYSDGTRYPINMGHYDAYPLAVGAAAAAPARR